MGRVSESSSDGDRHGNWMAAATMAAGVAASLLVGSASAREAEPDLWPGRPERSEICRLENGVDPVRRPRCDPRPTTRLAIAANLDANVVPRFRPGWLVSTASFPFRGPVAFVHRVTIVDEHLHERVIELGWGRGPSWDAWYLRVDPNPPPPEATDPWLSGHGEGSIRIPPPPRNDRIFLDLNFDASGELNGPVELTVSLALVDDSIPLEEAADSSALLEQEITLSLQTTAARTTQYDAPFSVSHLENNGWGCPESPSPVGECRLSRRLQWRRDWQQAGSIQFSSAGKLMSSKREHVQGRAFDLRTGTLSPKDTDVRAAPMLSPPAATSIVQMDFSVDETDPIDEREDLDRWSEDRPIARTEVVTVFDSLGRPHALWVDLSRIGRSRWAWRVFEASRAANRLALARRSSATIRETPVGDLSALEITNPIGGVFSNAPDPLGYLGILPLPGGWGVLEFDSSGRLSAVEQAGLPVEPSEHPVVAFSPGRGARDDQGIALDFGVGQTEIGGPASTRGLYQDGYSAGTLASLDVSPDYELVGGFSNGQQLPLFALSFASRGEAVCSFACSNRRDDDGDGVRDARRDPGCSSPIDGSERSSALPCDDGRDQDRDGRIDYPKDPSCRSPEDPTEAPAQLALHVVERLRAKDGESVELELALLGRGGAAVETIDPESLRLEPDGLRPIVPEGRSSPLSPWQAIGGLDADCDGKQDRFVTFRIDRASATWRARRICVTGTMASTSHLPGQGADTTPFTACTDQRSLDRHRRFRAPRPKVAPERKRPFLGHVAVDSSHLGFAANPDVFSAVTRALATRPGRPSSRDASRH